jgi:NDP-sugar pyrophosphorylase family protein
MIFAAGLGTRLQPITSTIPKALVEVNGVPLIEKVIKKLIGVGVTDIIVNLHHYPEKIKAFIESKNNFQINIAFSSEAELLDTGGGLLNAAHFFDDGKSFILHNTDVLSSIDLTKMIRAHEIHRPLVTLFVQSRESSRYLLFSKAGYLAGWENVKTSEIINASKHGEQLKRLAFNGIHIIDPHIFSLFNSSGRFSIITEYLRLAGQHHIMAYENNDCKYIDAGKPESLLRAAAFGL